MNGDAQQFRSRRMRLGIAISIISKVSAIGVHLVAIPIGISFCGLPEYTAYATLVAASLLPSVLLLRLGPSFTARYASCLRGSDESATSNLFAAGMIATTVHIIAATVFLVAIFCLAPIQSHIDPSGVLGPRAIVYAAILTAMSVIGGFFTPIEAAQAGAHETHLLATRSTIANSLSFAMIVCLTPIWNDIFVLVLALQFIPFASRFVNACFFLYRHKPFSCVTVVKADLMRPLVFNAWTFTVMAGPANYVALQAPILVLATLPDTRLASWMIVGMNLVMQASRGMSLALGPVVPAIADARSMGEYRAIRKYKNGLIGFALVLGLASLLGSLAVSPLSTAFGRQPPAQITSIASAMAFFATALFLESSLATCVYAIGIAKTVFRVYYIVIARCFIGFAILFIGLRSGAPQAAFLASASFTVLASLVPISGIYRNAEREVQEIACLQPSAS